MARIEKEKNNQNDEPLEKKLWKAADKLRKNMDAAEYKHIVLGLIFLKYISDAFLELHQKLIEGKGEYEGADPEDKNEYTAEKVFYVPPSSRWNWLQGRGKLPTIGKDVDEAMDAIEKDNPSLRGVLPKVFAQEKLDKQSLGGLIDLIGSAELGTEEARGKDLLGKVFEYFLGEFALAEGKKGGQFYTPGSVVKLLVEMLEPYEGRVFDPCCGSGGMFVQSEKFIEAHQDHYKKNNGKKLSIDPKDRISIYGQESNQTTWRLAKMNLAIRGIDSSNVKTANRKRIAMAIDILNQFTQDNKQQIFQYIRSYCEDVPVEGDTFLVSTDDHLKKILYGIEQRYYTTPIGNEKRLANSILKLSND